jgi:hypothetical protein
MIPTQECEPTHPALSPLPECHCTCCIDLLLQRQHPVSFRCDKTANYSANPTMLVTARMSALAYSSGPAFLHSRG